jgi:multidrug resistance protein
MIFQGLTPGMFAAVSDSVGRRPTYMFCFIVYVGSNIGLACTKHYWLLMLLRAIQATGNSATVALGAGVIADIAAPRERGGYLGIFGVGPLAGPSLGPIIGGALAQSLGWRSIFWFLAIFGGVYCVLLVMFLPETLRSIVGDGSVRPRTMWHVSLLEVMFTRRDSEENRESLETKKRTNVLESFIIIFQKDVVLILLAPSIFYTIYIMGTVPRRANPSNHVRSPIIHRKLQSQRLPHRTVIHCPRRRHPNRLRPLGQTPRQRLAKSRKSAPRKRFQKTQVTNRPTRLSARRSAYAHCVVPPRRVMDRVYRLRLVSTV